MQNYHLDSIITTYSTGPAHKDNINLLFLGTSFGTGYTFKKDKFMLDLDVGLKILWLLKGTVNQTYSYGNYNPYGLYNATYSLRDKTDQNGSHSTKIAAYYAKANVSYMLLKNIYFNIGISYTGSFIPLHGDIGFVEYSDNNGGYTYSFSMQQFSVHSGFAIIIK